MRKIFCFIFGISFTSFGTEHHHNGSRTPQSEVQQLINACDNVCRHLETRQNSDPKFRENNVLLVGPSGVGKDSLLYYFKKIPLIITDLGELEASAPLEGVCIGHAGSETIIPASVVVDGITYWSCPGFDDTRSSTQDLVNMFAINNILRGNIKIVIVIDKAKITSGRQGAISECIKNIKNNMLSTISKDLSQHLGLIVTRGEYQSSQKTIKNLIADIASGHLDRDYNDVVPTVKYLIEKRIAYFPEPASIEGPYPDDCRDDILKMIQEIPDYLKLENDTIPIKIDNDTKSCLGDMHAELLAQTNDILANYLFKYIEILLDNFCKDFSVKKELGEKIDVFSSNPKQLCFADKIKDIRTKMNAVHKDSKQHIFLDNIRKFFMDILHDNSDAVTHLEQIKRISTHIEFVCKYYDAPSDIKEWTDGSHRLYKKLLHCENYISEEYKEAAIDVAAATGGVFLVGAAIPIFVGGGAAVGAFVGLATTLGASPIVGSIAGLAGMVGGAVGGGVAFKKAWDAV